MLGTQLQENFLFKKKKLQEILVGFGEKQLGSVSMWRFEMKGSLKSTVGCGSSPILGATPSRQCLVLEFFFFLIDGKVL